MSKKNTTSFELNSAQLPKAKAADLARLDAMRDADIDYSDIPELNADFWKNAQLLRPSPKAMISLRVDKEVLAWFRTQGKGYQSYMNAVLRAFSEAQKQT